MKEIKDALWKDYKKISDRIENVKANETESYKIALEERDKIRNELIKLEQIQQERNTSDSKIESETKRDNIRNIITISTFVISTALSAYAIGKTFKFDQDSTVTSTLGRNILNGVVPKLTKR